MPYKNLQKLPKQHQRVGNKLRKIQLKRSKFATPDGPAFDSRQSSKRKSKTPTKIDSKIL